MAPPKNTRGIPKNHTTITIATSNNMPLAEKTLTRRMTNNIIDQNIDNTIQTRAKRKGDLSPIRNEKIKRSALGNLTNNVKANINTQHPLKDAKQDIITKKKESQNLEAPLAINNCLVNGNRPNQKITTRATAKNANNNINKKVEPDASLAKAPSANSTINNATKLKKLDSVINIAPPPPPPAAPVVAAVAVPVAAQMVAQHAKPVRRISNDFNKTEDTLYMSALEDISCCDSLRFSGNFEAAKRRSALQQQQQDKLKSDVNIKDEKEVDSDISTIIEQKKLSYEDIQPLIPEGVEDFDRANWDDPFQVSHYAFDIFNYLKSRETHFPIDDYMVRQSHLTKWMRSLLVDWMVEVQETFELNHETLYLAVKIVDLFLSRVVLHRDKLQLLGAAALFISCKFDERTPPLVEDFLYICDGAYKHDELIKMEMTTLRTINYDLGIPLSYRFLRRYARCAKVPMHTLTLARYILELSLMDYDTIHFSDSQMAAAVLYMALRMHGDEVAWTPTLEYYSGYKLSDFAEIIPLLNAGLHRKPKGTIKTIRSKYSHKIFHEVAKTKLMSTAQLFENNLDLDSSLTLEKMSIS